MRLSAVRPLSLLTAVALAASAAVLAPPEPALADSGGGPVSEFTFDDGTLRDTAPNAPNRSLTINGSGAEVVDHPSGGGMLSIKTKYSSDNVMFPAGVFGDHDALTIQMDADWSGRQNMGFPISVGTDADNFITIHAKGYGQVEAAFVKDGVAAQRIVGRAPKADWQRVTLVVDGTNQRLYTEGHFLGESTGMPRLSTLNAAGKGWTAYLGKNPRWSDQSDHDIDAVRVWHRALSPQEVREAGSVLPVDSAALTALVAEVSALDPRDWTSGTWSRVAARLGEAQTVLGDQYRTQTEVDDARTALTTAKGALVRQPRLGDCPLDVEVGRTVSCTVLNMQPYMAAYLKADGEQWAAKQTEADGSVSFSFTVPATRPAHRYPLSVMLGSQTFDLGAELFARLNGDPVRNAIETVLPADLSNYSRESVEAALASLEGDIAAAEAVLARKDDGITVQSDLTSAATKLTTAATQARSLLRASVRSIVSATVSPTGTTWNALKPFEPTSVSVQVQWGNQSRPSAIGRADFEVDPPVITGVGRFTGTIRIREGLLAPGVEQLTLPFHAEVAANLKPYSGVNRYVTSRDIVWDTGAVNRGGPLFIVSGEAFADALVAAPAAAAVGGNLLLIPTGDTAEDRETRVNQLNNISHQMGREVIAIGGTQVLPDHATRTFTLTGASLERISGRSRFETAQAVAERFFTPAARAQRGATGPAGALVAGSTGQVDALVGAVAAGQREWPILYMEKGSTAVPAATTTALDKVGAKQIVVAGGRGVVADGAVDSLKRRGSATVSRVGGVNRFETARQLAALVDQPTAFRDRGVVFANGYALADALAYGSVAAQRGWPLALVERDCLPAESLGIVRDDHATRVSVGGKLVIHPDLPRDLPRC